jgi:hypothetical protein
MSTLMKIVAVIGLAAISCGFGYLDRPQAVSDAIAMFGPPVEIAHLDGERIYYWQVREYGQVCKIWGIARHDVIVNWGYESCAY